MENQELDEIELDVAEAFNRYNRIKKMLGCVKKNSERSIIVKRTPLSPLLFRQEEALKIMPLDRRYKSIKHKM